MLKKVNVIKKNNQLIKLAIKRGNFFKEKKRVQATKILLVPQKCEINFETIWIFSIAFYFVIEKVVALDLFAFAPKMRNKF